MSHGGRLAMVGPCGGAGDLFGGVGGTRPDAAAGLAGPRLTRRRGLAGPRLTRPSGPGAAGQQAWQRAREQIPRPSASTCTTRRRTGG